MKFSTLTIVSALALGVTAEHIPVHFGKRHNFAARDQLSDTVANIQNNLTSGADNEDINNIQDLISKYQQSQEGKRDDQSAPVNDAVLNQTQSSNGSNCNLAQTIQQLFQNFQQLQAGNNRRDDVFGGIENFLKNMRRDDKLSEITQFLSEHQDEIQPLIQKLNQTQSSNKSQSSNEDNCDFAQAIQQLLQNFQQSQQGN